LAPGDDAGKGGNQHIIGSQIALVTLDGVKGSTTVIAPS
jgi:hypothetical protein